MNHTPLEQDPTVYLLSREVETPSERALAKELGAVEPHHVAAVAVRLHQQADWQARRDGWERFAKRAGGALAGLAMGNIAVVLIYWLHAHDARIVAEAEAHAAEKAEIEYRRGIENRLEHIEQDIRDLRKVCGLDPHPITIVKSEPRP